VTTRLRVLSIAGTDPTGGAGIQADLKTFAAHDAYGMAVVTAVVAQNTLGVRAVHVPPTEVLAAQLDAVSDDVTIDAVKIGMVASVENARAVAAWLARVRPPVVVLDPVLASSSGHSLVAGPQAEVGTVMLELARRADVVTPNIAELDALLSVARSGDAATLARDLSTQVLVTGGHLGGATSPDVLVHPDGTRVEIPGDRIETVHSHGTGCALSSALAALRPQREDWVTTVRDAKEWLEGALRGGRDLGVGRGSGPLDHLHHRPSWTGPAAG
jgi:hydroxymethylpyrimidine kinase/phosphomethylpyrimidine kinase